MKPGVFQGGLRCSRASRAASSGVPFFRTVGIYPHSTCGNFTWVSASLSLSRTDGSVERKRAGETDPKYVRTPDRVIPEISALGMTP
jgi:hypothetical protein